MKKNFLKISLWIFVFWILAIISYFSYDFYQKNSVLAINNISSKEVKNLDECKKIFSYDFEKNSKNKYFLQENFSKSLEYCKKSYDLESINLNEDWKCYDFMTKWDDFFEKNYTYLWNLSEKREFCFSKNFKPTFSVSSFFDIYNDFKTRIVLDDLWNAFYDARNIEKENENFEKYHLEAKKILKKILVFSDNIEIKDENIIIWKNKIFIDLNLKWEKKYTLKHILNESWKQKVLSEFAFETPKNNHFWLRVVNPVTLFTEKNLPKFEVLDFDSGKNSTKVKICKISEQDFAKIEVFTKTKFKDKAKKYFLENLENFKENCEEKELKIEKKENILNKISFDFNEFLKWKNWLFFVSFSDKNDFEFNSKINYPLFFWKVNSHILMKVSKTWDSFFYVNDLETWAWLENQEVFVYLNDFKESESFWNEKTSKSEEKDFLDEKKDIFSKEISLWKTDKDWILKVNLQEKFWDFYGRTFYTNGDESAWFYETFFVKSVSENYLSYMVSTWNWWIEPWNFWYDTYFWWKENLRIWYNEEEFNWHLFSERVLYLPSEEVYLKGIVRNSKDLSIPLNKKFILKIESPSWKEFFKKEVSLNEFWSFVEKISLPEDTENWYYSVNLLDDKDRYFLFSNFSVEVFKKTKLKTEIILKTEWLDSDYVKNIKTKDSEEYFWEKDYLANFKIKAEVNSKYYNWWVLANKKFSYKVFRQKYFSDDFWWDCFYWCFWSANREFYTEWQWNLDSFWKANFDVNVDFSSNFDDYKYIVEVAVFDDSLEENVSSNSVLAKLPESLKTYNPYNSLKFFTNSNFAKVWEKFKIIWWLENAKWTSSHNNNFIFVIKRKEYTNKKVVDSNGFERNISSQKEVLENVFFVNDKNFKLNENWKLELDYLFDKEAEYVIYYWALDKKLISKYLKISDPTKLRNQDIQQVFDIFEKNPKISLNYDDFYKDCNHHINWECLSEKIVTNTYSFTLDELFSSKDNFSLVAYKENSKSSNPILDDNKLIVMSDKVAYKIWEKAKILVRLPVSKSKILLTREIENIKHTEVVDISGNIFFKEFLVDESFEPNSYIWIFMMDLENKIPEYKVWYAEIIIDKTDKKSEISIKTDKDKYSPKQKVNLDINVTNSSKKKEKSEVLVAVVDDSLISLMGNINPNTLEFIYQKFPFLTQTSMSNIAMLKNYYFSRKWLVWWSWFADLKWWDSATNTRNIFKNTAYFWNHTTDENGNLKLDFELPDNLTSFRIMVISNSKNNYFWYAEKNIEVQKAISLEEKMPYILRNWEKIELWAMLTNNSWKDLNFKVLFESEKLWKKEEKNIFIKNSENIFVPFNVEVPYLEDQKVDYSFSVLLENWNLIDKIEKSLEIKQSPTITSTKQNFFTFDNKNKVEKEIEIPENSDLEKTKVIVTFANNKIVWVENILKTLEKEPEFYSAEEYIWQIEKNLILKKYSKIFNKNIDEKALDTKIFENINNLMRYKIKDSWFSYYENWNPNYYLTNQVLRLFLDLKNSWIWINDEVINSSLSYLEKNYFEKDGFDNMKAEIFYILKKFWKDVEKNFDENKLSRISYLYFTKSLLLQKEKNSEQIEKNIEFLKKSFEEKIERKDFYYFDNLLEKSIFTEILYEFDEKKYASLIEKNISELYEQDWTNNYFSTETRNNVLKTFGKYLEKNYKNNEAKFGFSLWKFSEKNYKYLNEKTPKLDFEFKLSDLVKDWKLQFVAASETEKPIFATISIINFPKDKTKVLENANKISLKKEFFEVVEENKILECQYEESNKNCKNIFKKVENNIFEKNKTYKVKIAVKSENPDIRNQIILQDYLSSSIKVLDSKFLNVSSNFKTDNNFAWYNVQKNANLIQAVTYTSKNEIYFEYFFKVSFSWKFDFPAATVKELYNPFKNANSDYKIFEIK